MKRNDWILLVAVLLYSLLFYNQTAGINFFIFSTTLVVLLGLKDKTLLGKRNCLMAAAGSLLSGICIAWHGNTLGIVANIISLSLLSGLSVNTGSSVILALLFSAYSYVSSPVYMIINYVERKSDEQKTVKSSRKLVLILVPLIVTILFFFIYRSSSTLFDALASKINWSFISWSWILFTIGGFILLYGFFYHQRINEMAMLDDKFVSNVAPKPGNTILFFGKEITLADEDFSARLLFILLNALLLIVNVLDVDFIFGGQHLPLGVTPKQFVHQGTNMLITSIVFAIAIILYYFRGNLNFYEKNKTIKVLACVWVAQNALMVFSTACRNNLYIQQYGLTYKRIGVYIYLLLTLVGLFTTLIKVINAKSNMYLFRKNGWIFYSLLIVLSFPDWDRIICEYNMGYIKDADTAYLLSLSDNAIPIMLPLIKKDSSSEFLSREPYDRSYCARLYNILQMHNYKDIRSWNYDDIRVYSEITSKEFTDSVEVLDFSNIHLDEKSLAMLAIYNKVTTMRLHDVGITSIRVIQNFTALRKLDLKGNDLLILSGIENFKNLEKLGIDYDRLCDYTPLKSLKNLKELYVNVITPDECMELGRELPGVNVQIGAVL